MKVLLLSAYDAASHRRWREGLVAVFPEYDWTVLTLPPRYFSWRLRGNSLSWGLGQREILSRPYDLLIATSMTDLSALKGMVPNLANTPTLVYFHENQFAYPESEQQFSTVEPQLLNIYTALAADRIAFNSRYNRDSFLQGAQALLAKMPDHVPPGVIERLQQHSLCLPVPMEQHCYQREPSNNDRLELLWNHRWEYDKAPERLWLAIQKLLKKTSHFRLHVVGQQFRRSPAVFNEMRNTLAQDYPEVLGQWGFQEDEQQYRALLKQSDVVISTALHDFQGLSVIEAVCAGCLPLVPNRLCYGEWFSTDWRYASIVEQPEIEAEALAEKLCHLIDVHGSKDWPSPPCLERLSWRALRSVYQEAFEQTINSVHTGS